MPGTFAHIAVFSDVLSRMRCKHILYVFADVLLYIYVLCCTHADFTIIEESRPVAIDIYVHISKIVRISAEF